MKNLLKYIQITVFGLVTFSIGHWVGRQPSPNPITDLHAIALRCPLAMKGNILAVCAAHECLSDMEMLSFLIPFLEKKMSDLTGTNMVIVESATRREWRIAP